MFSKFISKLLIFSGLTFLLIYFYFFRIPKKPAKPIKYALLLGCPSKDDGSYSASQKKRCELAIEAYRQNKYQVLIISGGAVKNKWIEAEQMKKYIQARCDIPMILEPHAKNTYENMKFTKELIDTNSILILTSSVHASRANALARQFFKHPVLWTYKDRSWKHKWREFLSRLVYIQFEIKKKWTRIV